MITVKKYQKYLVDIFKNKIFRKQFKFKLVLRVFTKKNNYLMPTKK